MRALNPQARQSTGSLTLSAAQSHAKKPSLDLIHSTFQRLFQQPRARPLSNPRAKPSRSFPLKLPDNSMRALLKQSKPNRVFDLRKSQSKLSFEEALKRDQPLQRYFLESKAFRNSSRPQLEAIPSDKSKSPELSRQIPTCKLQKRFFGVHGQEKTRSETVFLHKNSIEASAEQNATLKIVEDEGWTTGFGKKSLAACRERKSVGGKEFLNERTTDLIKEKMKNVEGELKIKESMWSSEKVALAVKVSKLKKENKKLRQALMESESTLSDLKKDVKDFLLLQYLGDLSENSQVTNRIDELIKDRYKEMYPNGGKGEATLSEERINQIIEMLTTQRKNQLIQNDI